MRSTQWSSGSVIAWVRKDEVVGEYGTSCKASIHEALVDEILNRIGFSMHAKRDPDPIGGRVQDVLSRMLMPFET
jgi:cyanate lyase